MFTSVFFWSRAEAEYGILDALSNDQIFANNFQILDKSNFMQFFLFDSLGVVYNDISMLTT